MYRTLAGCLLLVLGLTTQGQAMAFSKTLYLFSEIQGIVLKGSQPVADAQIEQRYDWQWKSQKGEQRTRSDAQGRFGFAEVTGKSMLGGLMMHQPVIIQELHIQHAGQSYKAWLYKKGDYENNSEVPGRSIRLVCDLDAEPAPLFEDGPYGICRLE